MANGKECDHIGLDPKIVERFEKRITKLLRDMQKHGLNLFCGSSCSIDYVDDPHKTRLIVGDFLGQNTDGG